MSDKFWDVTMKVFVVLCLAAFAAIVVLLIVLIFALIIHGV